MQGHPAEGGVGEGKDLQSEPVAAAGVAALQVSPALQSYQQGMRGAYRQSKPECDFGEPQAARRLREHFQNRERPIHGGGELFREPAMCPCDPKQSTAYTHCAGPQNCPTPTIRSRSSFWTLRHLAQRWSASRRRSSIPRAGLPSGRRQPRGFPAGADRSLEVEPGPELDGSVAGGVAGNIPEVRAGYVGDRIGHSLAIECVQEIRAYGGDVLLFEA